MSRYVCGINKAPHLSLDGELQEVWKLSRTEQRYEPIFLKRYMTKTGQVVT